MGTDTQNKTSIDTKIKSWRKRSLAMWRREKSAQRSWTWKEENARLLCEGWTQREDVQSCDRWWSCSRLGEEDSGQNVEKRRKMCTKNLPLERKKVPFMWRMMNTKRRHLQNPWWWWWCLRLEEEKESANVEKRWNVHKGLALERKQASTSTWRMDTKRRCTNKTTVADGKSLRGKR